MMMINETEKKCVVLAGDSIFDNAIYVPVGKPVDKHLKDILPEGMNVVLMAVDGAVSADVPAQLKACKEKDAILFISCGGNDALGAIGLLETKAKNVYGAMTVLSQMRERFRNVYRPVLEKAQRDYKTVVVCTVYDSVPGFPIELMTALALFNDVIIFEAKKAKIPVIDLRVICNEAADYSKVSPIEPSDQGGKKIAAAIAEWVKNNVHNQ